MCPLQMVLPSALVPTALALASPATCVCIGRALAHRRDRLLRARAAPIANVIASRPASRAPHDCTDRLIKKKTQGKRNLPDNEAVTKWRIIETLARATPEEIVEFAFALCAPWSQ